MDKPLIHLVFTDDWELRGDGSGDIERLQFAPLRRLLTIFENHGVGCTIMPEVMQQLTFRRDEGRFPELADLADAWDECLRDAVRRSHDVQLHLHSQWSEYERRDERWSLNGDWSIVNYSPAAAEKMVVECKSYLERLLHPVAPGYKCVAFRGSYLHVAPSPFLFRVLAKCGIELDLSIVGGLKVDNPNIRLDYTDCEEDLLPFYPDMTDARRVSSNKEPITCLPIFHWTGSRRRVARQIADKVLRKAKARSDVPYPTDRGAASFPARLNDKLLRPLVFGKHLTADIGQLGLPLLREMLTMIRKRAAETGLEDVPVVLTNHSKNMVDFDGFDRFLGEAVSGEDIRTITVTQLNEHLRSGRFFIRKRDINPSHLGTKSLE